MSDNFSDAVDDATMHLLKNIDQRKALADQSQALRMEITQQLLSTTDPLARDNLREQIAVIGQEEDRVHDADLRSTDWVLAAGSLKLAHAANKHSKALVRATRLLAAATIVLAAATVALIFATLGSGG